MPLHTHTPPGTRPDGLAGHHPHQPDDTNHAGETLVLTKEQLDRRRSGVGASEVAAVLGMTPRRTPLMVYETKQPGAKEWEGNEATQWGNTLEPVVAELYGTRLAEREEARVDLFEVGTIEGTKPHEIATPDRIVRVTQSGGAVNEHGLEVKVRSFRTSDWGEDGSDQVPVDVYYQCLWGMIVTGHRRWDVAALFSGTEMRIYHLDYNEALATEARADVAKFWTDHVLPGVPPAPMGGDNAKLAGSIKQLHAASVKLDDLPLPKFERDAIHESAVYLAAIKAQAKALEEQQDQMEVQLKAAIGPHAGIVGPDFEVKWGERKGRSVTDWRAVAEHLYGLCADKGDGLEALIQHHTERGEPTRAFTLKYWGGE